MTQLSVYVWAAIAGVALVVWGAWQRGIIGWIGRIGLTLLALAISGSAVFLFSIGQKAHWQSDGPGMLFVMFGIALCVLFALGGWGMTIGAWLAWRRGLAGKNQSPSAAAGREPSGGPRAAVPLAIVLVCAIAGTLSWLSARRNKPAHDAAIAGVAFVGDVSRIYSIDVSGVLKVWTLTSALPTGSQGESPYRVEATLADVPGSREARDMWVSTDGRHLALLGPTGVTVVGLDSPPRRARLRYAVSDGTSAAAAPGGGFVVAGPRGLRWFSPDSEQPTAATSSNQAIVALTGGPAGIAFADAGDKVFFASAAGAEPVLLGQLPFTARALSFSGDGSAIVVSGSSAQGMAFDVGSGAARATDTSFGRFVRPLVGAFVLDCSQRSSSCVVVNGHSGRSGAAFSGIARSYDHLDASPGAALIASGSELLVVSMPKAGYEAGSAPLKDPRF